MTKTLRETVPERYKNQLNVRFPEKYILLKVSPEFEATYKNRKFPWKDLVSKPLDAFVFLTIRSLVVMFEHQFYPQFWLDVCYLKSPPWTRQEKIIHTSRFLSSYSENEKDEANWKRYFELNETIGHSESQLNLVMPSPALFDIGSYCNGVINTLDNSPGYFKD